MNNSKFFRFDIYYIYQIYNIGNKYIFIKVFPLLICGGGRVVYAYDFFYEDEEEDINEIDFRQEEKIEELLYSDEITPEEAAFMEGYERE